MICSTLLSWLIPTIFKAYFGPQLTFLRKCSFLSTHMQKVLIFVTHRRTDPRISIIITIITIGCHISTFPITWYCFLSTSITGPSAGKSGMDANVRIVRIVRIIRIVKIVRIVAIVRIVRICHNCQYGQNLLSHNISNL